VYSGFIASCCKFVIIILANSTIDNIAVIYEFTPLEADNGNWHKMTYEDNHEWCKVVPYNS